MVWFQGFLSPLLSRAAFCRVNQSCGVGWEVGGRVLDYLAPGDPGFLPVKWGPTANEVKDTESVCP